MPLSEGLKRLVDQARKDPAFFHALVFDPEKVISRLSYLDRKTKGALLRLDPDVLIRNLIPIEVAECGDTCGAGSCTATCGAGSCTDTCGSSCGGTCGSSCDHTSGMGTKYIPDDPLKGAIGAIGAKGVVAVAREAAARRRR
jgi:hypothetical protein